MDRETFTHKLNSILMMHGLDTRYTVRMGHSKLNRQKIYLFNKYLGYSVAEINWDEYADPCLMLCNLFEGEYKRFDADSVHASFLINVMHGFQCLAHCDTYLDEDFETECVTEAMKGTN